MADWEGIGNMLQGMGAGFSGNLPQYMVAQRTKEEAEYLKDERRRQALIRDFAQVYSLGSQGQWDSAEKLLNDRTTHIQRLGGDPSDTQGLLDQIKAGNHEEVMGELGAFIQSGILTGDIQGGASENPYQFGPGFMAKDSAGNLFQGTQARNPATGQVETVMAPVGHNAPQQGGLQMVGSMGMTSGETIDYRGQASGAESAARERAQYQYAAPIAGAEATARANVEAATAPGIAAATTMATKSAENAAERGSAARTNATAFDAYNQAMAGVRTAFSGTDTGPIAGRILAVTAAQQGAEGARAAAAPVLKQLFRSAGEGVFTDKDQQLLMDMMPDRKDHPEVVQQKLGTIDAIVKAKLNMNGAPAPKSGGTIMMDAQGNKAMVYPDGTVEEIR